MTAMQAHALSFDQFTAANVAHSAPFQDTINGFRNFAAKLGEKAPEFFGKMAGMLGAAAVLTLTPVLPVAPVIAPVASEMVSAVVTSAIQAAVKPAESKPTKLQR